MAERDLGYVLAEFDWMRSERIWPHGLRHLWTDAFGPIQGDSVGCVTPI